MSRYTHTNTERETHIYAIYYIYIRPRKTGHPWNLRVCDVGSSDRLHAARKQIASSDGRPNGSVHQTLTAVELVKPQNKHDYGRAVAQTIGRRLPNAAARVQCRVMSFWDLWWTKLPRSGFLLVLPFLLSFYRLVHTHLHDLSAGGATIGQLVAPVIMNIVQPQEIKEVRLH
jgi:hypothetical protein